VLSRSLAGRLIVRLAGLLPPGVLRWLGRAQFTGGLTQRIIRASYGPLVRSDVTIAHGPARGLRFNAAGTNPGYVLGTTEPDVQRTVAAFLQEGSVFYDLGAGVGFFTVLGARRVGPEGHVVAFEPLTANVDALAHNVAMNGFTNVSVVRKAVGRSSGSGVLEVARFSVQGRLNPNELRPDSRGTVPVEVISVDQAVQETPLPPPTLVKLDIEGSELEAIDGMRRTMERFRPTVICELHWTNRPFAALMSELGYDLEVIEDGFGAVTDAPGWVHVLGAPKPLGDSSATA
jgi:FkbM family methyltransferase